MGDLGGHQGQGRAIHSSVFGLGRFSRCTLAIRRSPPRKSANKRVDGRLSFFRASQLKFELSFFLWTFSVRPQGKAEPLMVKLPAADGPSPGTLGRSEMTPRDTR